MKKILGLAAKARSGKDTAASILLAHPRVAAYALADPLKRGCQALFALSDAETWDDTVKEIPLAAWGLSPREFFQLVGTEWMRAHDPLHWLKRADREINGRPSIRSPILESPQSLTADAPLIVAANIFFDLNDQSWDADLRHKPDAFWSLSPTEMVDLIKSFVYRDFPAFDAQRAQHIKNSTTHNKATNRIQTTTAQENLVTAPIFDATDKDIIIIKDIRFENEAAYIRRLKGEIWHIIRNNAKSVKMHSSEAGIQVIQGDKIIYNTGTLQNYKLAVEQAWSSLSTKLKLENKPTSNRVKPENTNSRLAPHTHHTPKQK